jgi:hypothetical protein
MDNRQRFDSPEALSEEEQLRWQRLFDAVDEADFDDFLEDRDQGEYEEHEPLDD